MEALAVKLVFSCLCLSLTKFSLKILGTNHECKSEFSKKFKGSGLEAIKELKKIDSLREGGGGGGASVVHLVSLPYSSL